MMQPGRGSTQHERHGPAVPDYSLVGYVQAPGSECGQGRSSAAHAVEPALDFHLLSGPLLGLCPCRYEWNGVRGVADSRPGSVLQRATVGRV